MSTATASTSANAKANTAPVPLAVAPGGKPNLVQTDWSKLSTPQRIKHLEIEGYVVLPDLIPFDEVQRIRAELDRLPTVGTDYSEHQRGYSDVQWSDSPSCINLIALPAMIEFLTTLFGDELICTSCVFAFTASAMPRRSRMPLKWTPLVAPCAGST